MNADFESDAYANHHRQLSRCIHRFVQRTLVGMTRLQRRQFAAPWQALQRTCHDEGRSMAPATSPRLRS